MRQFVWGMIFGACAMYFYTFHWQQVEFAKGFIDSWREDAVRETGKYGPS